MADEAEVDVAETEMLIECNEALDVSVAADFKSMLQQAASQNTPIVLDTSQLVRVDGAGLQLLTAFFLEAEESGLSVSWRNPAEALLQAAELTGLKETLQL